MNLPKLQPDQITYLALEGGGGAGNAFPGALKALADKRLKVKSADQGILQYENYKLVNIKGISGASAGAITACLLSCGYDPEELEAIIKLQNFNDFFDAPKAGLVPRVGGYRQETPSDVKEALQLIELIVRGAFGWLSFKDRMELFRLLVNPRISLQELLSSIGLALGP